MQWLDALIQGVLLGGMFAQYALGISQSIGFHINPGFWLLAGHLVFLIVLALRLQGILGRS